MTFLVSAIALSLGLAFGSFANVLIFRLGLRSHRLTASSACMACGNKISKRDNVPVLSWLILRGRCRACGNRISIIYPVVELATAVFFVLIVNLPTSRPLFESASTGVLGALLSTTALGWFATAGVALAVIDFKTMRLPNVLVLSVGVAGVLGLGLASVLDGDNESFIRAALSSLAALVIFSLIILISPNGMGMGDVKLAGVLGFYLGWIGWGAAILGLLASFLLGAAYGLIMLVINGSKSRTVIPFGPWMILGSFLAIGFGDQVWNFYLWFLHQAFV